ncbi:MAG: hypothetical protein EHM61_05355 [Acidobacteria bacterium]|nr:MAG: hypothetical protein EHM61_05355 [Acidobacteriota bacterium]
MSKSGGPLSRALGSLPYARLLPLNESGRLMFVREVTPQAPLREEFGERADHCDYPDGKMSNLYRAVTT